MKKQDVLTAIQTKFSSVLSVKKVEQTENVAWYLANVLDAVGMCATKRNVGFYVADEGEEAEVAYWHGSEPKPSAPSKSFQQSVLEHLSSLVTAGTVEGAVIRAVDAVNRTATVAVWVTGTGGVALKEFFVDKDEQSKWRRREIL